MLKFLIALFIPVFYLKIPSDIQLVSTKSWLTKKATVYSFSSFLSFFEGDSKFELLFTDTDGKFLTGENVSDFVTNISY